MKKAILSAILVLLIVLLSLLVKIDPTRALITMVAYWVFLDHLEREDKNED
jgi:hypothetical protein